MQVVSGVKNERQMVLLSNMARMSRLMSKKILIEVRKDLASSGLN